MLLYNYLTRKKTQNLLPQKYPCLVVSLNLLPQNSACLVVNFFFSPQKPLSEGIKTPQYHMKNERTLYNLPAVGGALCLDFVNTLQSWKKENAKDYLPNYKDFIFWCQDRGLIDVPEMRRLYFEDYCDIIESKRLYQKVTDRRKLLHQIFNKVRQGKKLPFTLLEAFQLAMAEVWLHLRFDNTENGLQQVWRKHESEMGYCIWMIAKSAYDLLQTDPTLIRECPGCGWLFLAKTPAEKRTWCSPALCGSRDKSRRRYHAKLSAKARLAV